MVLADSRRVPPAPRYSGYCHAEPASRTGLSPAAVELSSSLPVASSVAYAVLQPRTRLDAHGLGSSPFARHYLGNSLIGLFSSGYLDVSVPPVGALSGGRASTARLPHSDIRGSGAVCASPRLFAAYHVLHSLWMPRHPRVCPCYFLSTNGLPPACLRSVPLPLRQCTSKPGQVSRGPGTGLPALAYYVQAAHPTATVPRRFTLQNFVENIGFEPMTPCLQGRCSSQLS